MDFVAQSFQMRSSLAVLTVACGLAGSSGATAVAATTLDSRATFIHTASADSSLNSVAIALAPLGIAAGDRIQIMRTGEFDNGPQGDTFTSLIGVFSSSAALLPASNLHRVPGAIAAGVPYPTSVTYFGSEPTDIPEDFVVCSADYPSGIICVVVPAGATHLFLAPHDSLYEDNSDPNSDYGYALSLLDPCVADMNGSGAVDGADLGTLLGSWGAQTVIGGAGDLNCDGTVNGADLGVLLGSWGSCGG